MLDRVGVRVAVVLLALAAAQSAVGGDPPSPSPRRLRVDRTVGRWTGTMAIDAVFGLSPDGSVVAVRSRHGVRVLDTSTGLVTREFPSPPVVAVAFSADGASLVFGRADRQVVAHRLTDGSPRWAVPTEAAADALYMSPDAAHVAVLAAGSGVQILSTADGSRVAEIPTTARDPAVAWSANGDALLVGDGPRVIRWSRPGFVTGEPIVEASSEVRALAAEPRGAWIAWGDASGAVRVRAVGSERERALRPPDGSAVVSIAVVSATELCVSTLRAVEVWSLVAPGAHPVLGVDGLNAVAAASDVLVACDLAGGELRLLRSAKAPTPVGRRWERRSVLGLAATTTTVALARPGGRVERWAHAGTPTLTSEVRLAADVVLLSPDAEFAAAALDDRLAWFDTATGHPHASIGGGTSGDRLRFSSGGTSVVRWVPASGFIVGRVVGGSGTPEGAVAFPMTESIADFQLDDRTGHLVVGTPTGDLRVVERSGRVLRSIRVGMGLSHLVVPRDGSVLVAGDDGTVVRWGPEGGTIRRAGATRGATRALATSPSGAVAVVATADGDVVLLDAYSLATIAEAALPRGAMSVAVEDDTHVWVGTPEGVAHRLALETR